MCTVTINYLNSQLAYTINRLTDEKANGKCENTINALERRVVKLKGMIDVQLQSESSARVQDVVNGGESRY